MASRKSRAKIRHSREAIDEAINLDPRVGAIAVLLLCMPLLSFVATGLLVSFATSWSLRWISEKSSHLYSSLSVLPRARLARK
jgi:hypothetical protein